MGKKIKKNFAAAASSSSSLPPPPPPQQQQQQQQHPANSINATHRVDPDAAQQKEQIMVSSFFETQQTRWMDGSNVLVFPKNDRLTNTFDCATRLLACFSFI
jgi:hypothetical protein